MTVLLRQIRTLITETPLRQKKQHEPASNNNKKVENRRKSLTVKISKEPPAIVYFERDKLEDSFECIFDPQVHHDKEEDHPDLAADKVRKRGSSAMELKPWMKPPYCDNKPTFMSRFKSAFS